jgi:hypothetical protein
MQRRHILFGGGLGEHDWAIIDNCLAGETIPMPS